MYQSKKAEEKNINSPKLNESYSNRLTLRKVAVLWNFQRKPQQQKERFGVTRRTREGLRGSRWLTNRICGYSNKTLTRVGREQKVTRDEASQDTRRVILREGSQDRRLPALDATSQPRESRRGELTPLSFSSPPAPQGNSCHQPFRGQPAGCVSCPQECRESACLVCDPTEPAWQIGWRTVF